MIAFNRDVGDRVNQSVPTISSAGGGQMNVFGSESAHEYGQIVHVLSTQQLKKVVSHPAAKIFPCLPADIDRMRESLRNSGQQQPITLYGDGSEIVLDGNCRVQAAIPLEISLSAILLDDEALNGLTPEAWVFRRNRANQGGRRLNDTQLALIAVRAAIETARREAEARKHNGVVVGEQKGEAYLHIARMYELTPNRCRQAIKVYESADQDLEDLVYRGRLSISKAAEIAGMSVAERRVAVESALAKRGGATFKVATWSDALKAIKRCHRSLKTPAANLASLVGPCREFGAEEVTSLEQASQALATALAALARIIESEVKAKNVAPHTLPACDMNTQEFPE